MPICSSPDAVRAAAVEARAYDVRRRMVENCPRCHGTGMRFQDHYNTKLLLVSNSECSCSRRFRRYFDLMIAGLHEQLIDELMSERLYERQVVEFDIGTRELKPPSQLIADHLQPYVRNHQEVQRRGYSYLFIGVNSLGKTFCALKVLLAYLGRGCTGHYIKFRALMKLINRTITEKGDDRRQAEALLDEIKNVDLLVIDELGKETGSRDHIAGEVEELLKDRDMARRPVIAISNYDYTELENIYTLNVTVAFMRNYRVLIFNPEQDLRRAARKIWFDGVSR